MYFIITYHYQINLHFLFVLFSYTLSFNKEEIHILYLLIFLNFYIDSEFLEEIIWIQSKTATTIRTSWCRCHHSVIFNIHQHVQIQVIHSNSSWHILIQYFIYSLDAKQMVASSKTREGLLLEVLKIKI